MCSVGCVQCGACAVWGVYSVGRVQCGACAVWGVYSVGCVSIAVCVHAHITKHCMYPLDLVRSTNRSTTLVTDH